MANVAIARLGKSIRFRRKDIGLYAFSGAGEARTLFLTLTRLNPQNTYYIVGKSDYQRLTEEERKELFPNDNVIDVWEEYKDHKGTIANHDYVVAMMAGVKVDYGVMFGGVISLSLPNKTRQKRDNTKFAKPMACYYNYASPVVNYLNETGIPWVCANTDTRYYPVKAVDLLNPEKVIVGMWDTELEATRRKSFDSEELTTHKVISLYSRIETLFLADDGKLEKDLDLQMMRSGLTIFHNQDGGIDKAKTMKEYIIDNGLDFKAFGKWKSFEGKDDRFKGFLAFDDLHKELQKSKYTFIIAGNEVTTCTMKFWECLHYGVIPFLHENYDKNKILNNYGFPDYLRVKDPEDLKRKIEELESDYKLYAEIRLQLNDMLTEDLYNGEHINNEINRALKIGGII